MPRTVSTGAQDFEMLISRNNFYVDKTMFIKEWWESEDTVTLIARPRRFGKTLNMSMMDWFWNVKHGKQTELFEHLAIWKEEKYRELQGTYPVISLSLANVKETDYETAVYRICGILQKLYIDQYDLLKSDVLTEGEKRKYKSMAEHMTEQDAPIALHCLSDYLCRYYGRKVLIFLDEYDTPMQESYVRGYWDQLASFTRNLFHASFKTNPYLERAILTGITRIGRESIFSDLNNIRVVTATSDAYASCFGFTEEEVFAAMDEFGLEEKEEAKKWYDGFTFGKLNDIYNPWSITCMLKEKRFKTYWANTSSNTLVSSLLREGSQDMKMAFECLLQGGIIESRVDEEIVYNQLEDHENAAWSLLLASGYLKVTEIRDDLYALTLTNYEVKRMFEKMIRDWFGKDQADYNGFVKALLLGDLRAMNTYMNRVSVSMFSSFDGGNKPSTETNPERFYHGFVLGLLVELEGRYAVTSNRESGFGRYDVLLEPLRKGDDGMILEFKVQDPEMEEGLEETVQAALKQIEEKKYDQILLDHGIARERIRRYGLAFQGKRVLIGVK